MSIQIDHKYALQVGHYIKGFEQVSSDAYLMRCPYCGDSKKSATKKRGNLSVSRDSLVYHCFNCGISKSFYSFIQDQCQPLFSQYTMETYEERKLTSWDYAAPKQSDGDLFKSLFGEDKVKKIVKSYDYHGLVPVTNLPKTHPVNGYMESRCLSKFKDMFYYVPKFYSWAARWKPDFIDLKKYDHPRLILPMFDTDGVEQGFTARAFGNEQPKYIMIKTNDDGSLMFGLDRIDPQKKIYVVEGPIDSLMLDNAVAVCNANLYRYNAGDVYISDNQPRNREIVSIMAKLVTMGKLVVIWPESWKYKDLNEAVIDGVDIQKVIEDNTFSGLKLKFKFDQWRMV